MASRLLRIGLLVALVVAGGVAIISVRRDNERLRRRAAEARQQQKQVLQLREENARARKLAAATAESRASATAAIRAEVLRLRGEIAELEARGAARQANAAAGAAALAANRDTEKDFVLVENFSNAGRGTPSAAFQTLVWAATKGDDAALASVLTFDPRARENVESMLAALPEAARVKYPNPESVAALYFANLVTGHTAARVLAQDTTDVQHATVTIAFERMPAGRPLTVRLAPSGWQLAVTDEMAGEFQRQLRGAPKK